MTRGPARSRGGLAAAVALAGCGAALAQTAVTVNVDAAADRHPIAPSIYGVAYGDAASLSDLRCPRNRLGGNNTSRYNWQGNADNRGSDWYFESIPYSSSAAGEVGDTFVSQSRAGGAEPMVTVPMIGWVAKAGPARSKLASFSIAKYGSQTGNDWQWYPDAGNGVRTSGGDVTGNDPNDASVSVDSAFQKGCISHLVGKWGSAASGGVRYFILDNEPSIWFGTHRDVHPAGPTMEEIRDRMLDYGARIKEADPAAALLGPEEWGWSGYLLSGYDQQYGSLHGWGALPDRAAHGNRDYLPWLLDALRRDEIRHGRRLLDFFTVHYYPQGGEFSDDVSTAMQQRRNRSTRSLWDPAYVDETWITDVVRLVPRLREWADAWYPFTPVGVTEYNWGAEGHINGATAQADVLGIFGRERLDLATRWTTPDPGSPTYKAMKLYRNYDGAGSGFGDTSVRAAAPDPDTLSAFAAIRSSDAALTVMVVHKELAASAALTLKVANYAAGAAAQAWQLTSSNAIARIADVAIAAGALSTSLPAQSVTLFVIPAAGVAIGSSLPASGPAEGGTALSIRGAGFAAGASVAVGGAAAGGISVSGPHAISATTPAHAPGNADVSVSLSGGGSALLPGGFFYDFHDVPGALLFHDAVVRIARASSTSGCGAGDFCPLDLVTRAQMAVFLLRGEHGRGYHPPAASGAVFSDVPAGSFAADWIERLAAEGITTGCGGGRFCPDDPVTRTQMAVFLLRAKHGSGFHPPAAEGLFADVPAGAPFADWIEELGVEGIAQGCGGGNDCPGAAVTRGAMAAFLTRAFGL
jgi:Glycoside hydrolase family 44/IPT/TIG domain/S-layer homology domain